jgi:type I restriction enzyme M protein
MSVYNKKENKGEKRSDTPTPLFLCDYIYNLIKDNNYKNILDPCCGDKRLTKNFKNCNIINYEIKEGTDFLKETNKINCDVCIMNPPFNVGTGRKLAVEVFLDQVINLCGHEIPIILLCPMGFRLNQKKTSKRLIKHKTIYPDITSIISLPVDTFDDTLYHSEVIIYNINNLKAHYFVDT